MNVSFAFCMIWFFVDFLFKCPHRFFVFLESFFAVFDISSLCSVSCLRCSRDSSSSRSSSISPPLSRWKLHRSSSSLESILMPWRSSTSRRRKPFTPRSSKPRPQNPSHHSLLQPTRPQVSLSLTSPPKNSPLPANLMLTNPAQGRSVKTGPSQTNLLRSQEQCRDFCLSYFYFLNLIYKDQVDHRCQTWRAIVQLDL